MEEREQDDQEAISKERPSENPMLKKAPAPHDDAANRDESHPQYDSFMRVIRR